MGTVSKLWFHQSAVVTHSGIQWHVMLQGLPCVDQARTKICFSLLFCSISRQKCHLFTLKKMQCHLDLEGLWCYSFVYHTEFCWWTRVPTAKKTARKLCKGTSWSDCRKMCWIIPFLGNLIELAIQRSPVKDKPLSSL